MLDEKTDAPQAPREAEQARSEAAPTRGSNPLLILVCLAQFMVILDVSIVNVALPSIRVGLDFSGTGLQWVVNAYTLTFPAS